MAIAALAQCDDHNEIAHDDGNASGGVMTAFSLQPTLKASRARISQRCRDPVHPLCTDKREDIVLTAPVRALEEGVVELFLSEKDRDRVMRNDTATAKRALVMRAVSRLVGQFQERGHHQPPSSLIRKMLNFSSDL